MVVMLMISFETAQQLYYIKKFQLAENVYFWELLKYQAIRWLVWLIMSYPLVNHINKINTKSQLKRLTLYKGLLLIVLLVSIDIFIIALIQLLIVNQSFVFIDLWQEYLPFYMYQKAPIYTLGYIALAIITYFYNTTKKLQIDVLQLEEIKKENTDLYTKLKSSQSNKNPVLKIKIGNRQKFISFNAIYWIQADDYCAKIHLSDNTAYAMRTSLKVLEQKLDNHFLRVHRGAIVNMTKVKEMRLNGAQLLILENNTEVSISQSKLKLVKDFYQDSKKY